MDLEKAYNKIDNLCLTNYNSTTLINKDIAKERMPEKIDFFKGYNETKDEDFCKDLDEMLDALETIKELVDLQKEIGCPLKVLFKALKQNYVYDVKTSQKVKHLNVQFYEPNNFWALFYGNWGGGYGLNHYKKTWCLKEDKSE